MAERKATNKYYPPEWEPKHGSINTFRGQHPLRERARKLKTEGILIVRFEMPYNVWCLHCNSHIGKGVRYNAEKKQAGSYFSTKIWSFRMKCHLCSKWMEIHTDPKSHDFVFVDGVRRKAEPPETRDDDEVEPAVVPLSDDQREKIATNPFYRLEHTTEDKRTAEKAVPRLRQLQDISSRFYKDQDTVNRILRDSFRETKRPLISLSNESKLRGLAIDLLPRSEDDAQVAAHQTFLSLPPPVVHRAPEVLSFPPVSSEIVRRSDTLITVKKEGLESALPPVVPVKKEERSLSRSRIPDTKIPLGSLSINKEGGPIFKRSSSSSSSRPRIDPSLFRPHTSTSFSSSSSTLPPVSRIIPSSSSRPPSS